MVRPVKLNIVLDRETYDYHVTYGKWEYGYSVTLNQGQLNKFTEHIREITKTGLCIDLLAPQHLRDAIVHMTFLNRLDKLAEVCFIEAQLTLQNETILPVRSNVLHWRGDLYYQVFPELDK